MANNGKAVVHVSGTLLRRSWVGPDLHSAIIVRPSGKHRDSVAYVVNQVKFNGPSEMVFNAKARKAAKGTLAAQGGGFVGALPGFDGAVMVYLEADEAHIDIQPKQGDKFIPFAEFTRLVQSKKLDIPTLNPAIEDGC